MGPVLLPALPVLPVFHSEGPTRSPVTLDLKLPTSRRRYAGLILSLAIHGVLLGLLVAHGDRLWSRTLPLGDPRSLAGNPGAGGGGNRVAYITLPSIPQPAAPAQPKVSPPVVPPKHVERPAPEPEQAKAPEPVPVDTLPAATAVPEVSVAQGTGPGMGTGQGSGDSAGRGRGQGNGVGGGGGLGPGAGGGSVRPPEPRDMAFPFDPPPKELRGISLNVTFWVRDDGRVERYEVDPEIKDRGYAKKFDEVMRAFRFTPARTPDGTRVPGTTKISFTLPGKSSS